MLPARNRQKPQVRRYFMGRRPMVLWVLAGKVDDRHFNGGGVILEVVAGEARNHAHLGVLRTTISALVPASGYLLSELGHRRAKALMRRIEIEGFGMEITRPNQI